ncbi:hypothetical protein [Bacillus sp. AFS029533]|uniref:hypothetical protein n=1 Tax=Bacillus sp. AFS029533 TaxID=2033494 RepID=UPI000BFE0759|nr:hypothetical protein [Bacillus sp. AFS029533]PGZ90935.1 hypothetical protein COE53_16500 [Bacillus sp. AFS029533]
MKKIFMLLCCTLILFGCSMKTKTETKNPQTVALVGKTDVDTIIYTADEDHNRIETFEKGFKGKKEQSGDIVMPSSDITLWFINDEGKKDEYNVNYKQNLVSGIGGKVYKLDPKTIQLLQEQFMN